MTTVTTVAKDESQPGLVAARGWPPARLSNLQPTILAGHPAPSDGAAADSPALRIDANVATSPFAGVGSLSVEVPTMGSFLCSGAAISPRHILTAAHCLDLAVAEDGIADVEPGDVTFNLNAQGVDAPPIALAASALHIFETDRDRYTGFTASPHNDLAIVTLKQSLPPGVPIYQLWQQPLPLQSIITLVGYGTTGNGVEGFQPGSAGLTIKRVGQNQVDDVSYLMPFISAPDEIFLYDFDGPDATTNALSQFGSGPTLGNQIETTVGPGDSGGPSFIRVDEQLRLAGVNTFGFTFPDAEAPVTEVTEGAFGTGGGGVIVSNAEKLAWIESIVGAELGQPSDAPGSITGTVWHDRDADGGRALAEPLLRGWTVYLDRNQNGRLDAAEPTTQTNGLGTYRFDNIEAGNYTVAVVAPPDWRQTFPTTGEVLRLNVDFSQGDVASLEGFTLDNTAAPAAGLWHLTKARGNPANASSPHSLYFGRGGTTSKGGDYDVGHTAGRATSPLVNLVGLASANLEFRYRLAVEADLTVDVPRVRVTTDGIAFQTVATKGRELTIDAPEATDWSRATVALDTFLGKTVQVQFDFDTVDAAFNQYEGWFVDDVVIRGTGSDRHTLTLYPGQRRSALDFGLVYAPSPIDERPAAPVQAAIGLVDYEQYRRYRFGDSAALPTAAIDNLPLAQLFDEDFYLRQNPDVAVAVQSGGLASGYDHFVTAGLFEGRNPSLLYSREFYLENNADVAQVIAAGGPQSGLLHFLTVGHEEGRNPSPFFDQQDYLTQNPDVAAAIAAGLLQSGFEHYLKFGSNELRSPQLALYNEAFYLNRYPDVAAAVNNGAFVDGFDHFSQFGQRENRRPSELFDPAAYLAANADVAAAVAGGSFTSAFDYYVQVGRFESPQLG